MEGHCATAPYYARALPLDWTDQGEHDWDLLSTLANGEVQRSSSSGDGTKPQRVVLSEHPYEAFGGHAMVWRFKELKEATRRLASGDGYRG